MKHRPLAFALLLAATSSLSAAATLTVTSISDVIDGDTSSPERLAANPGGDGITLAEAVAAASSAPGPHTITFVPGLAGKTIVLTRSSLTITRDGISIEGLVDSSGRPAITLDARALAPIVFSVQASNVTIRRLRFVMLHRVFGVWVNAGDTGAFPTPAKIENLIVEGNEFGNDNSEESFALPITIGTDETSSGAVVRGVRISGNTFTHFFGANGIHVHADGQRSTVQDVVIRGNTFSDIEAPVELVCAQGTRNRIIGVQVTGNEFSDSLQAVNLNMLGNNGVPLTENFIEQTLIADNVFRNNGRDVVFYGGAFSLAARNGIVDTQIVGNRMSDAKGPGSITINGGDSGGTGNVVRGVRIAGNVFRRSAPHTIWIVGGRDADANRVEDVSIVNNVITGMPLGHGIRLTAASAGNQNRIAGIRLAHNTIAYNAAWGTTIDPSTNGSGNAVADVSIANSIYWSNGVDFAGVDAAQVSNSIASLPGASGGITGDPRFVAPDGGDFRLQAGSSPALRAGSSAPAPYNDLECRMRTFPPDLGAYQTGPASSCAAGGGNFTALWWNPLESGWGLNVSHQGTTLFATLFTYAPDGRSLWLVGSNLALQGDGSYSGKIYRLTGPPFDRTPWAPVTLAEVGEMTIRYPIADTGVVNYSFNGVKVTKVIQRQFFSTPMPACATVSGSRAAEGNYQDDWWNPQESGWGINLAHQGSVIFATLFTYDEAGRDLWLIGSGLQRQADGSFAGALSSVRGPVFDSSPWTPVTVSTVGDMTLRFSSGESGSLRYTYNGTQVTKAITRLVFGATVPACR